MRQWIGHELVQPADTRIVLFVLDGVAGLPYPGQRGTALQVAHTPHLDDLAGRSSCGLLDPVAPGITPGSGPAHLGLFGYDPLEVAVGRGVLEALGAGFTLRPGDLAIRVNFCTVDDQGLVVDRRAGRISTRENQRLVSKLTSTVKAPPRVEFILGTAAEHRAYLVVRGEGLRGDLTETDPQRTHVPPRSLDPLSPAAAETSSILQAFVAEAAEVLRDEPAANMLLLRGYALYEPLPTFAERYGLRALALADYPMYRGLARLVGMEVGPPDPALEDRAAEMGRRWADRDFFFIHYKKTDSAGEDGDFAAKVRAIELADTIVPALVGLHPDVIVVTADHATPCVWKAHSWHPVPVMLCSRHCLPDSVSSFDELACVAGCLGRLPAKHLMPLMLANAGRLRKYGA